MTIEFDKVASFDFLLIKSCGDMKGGGGHIGWLAWSHVVQVIWSSKIALNRTSTWKTPPSMALLLLRGHCFYFVVLLFYRLAFLIWWSQSPFHIPHSIWFLLNRSTMKLLLLIIKYLIYIWLFNIWFIYKRFESAFIYSIFNRNKLFECIF